ncbi:MAG TPA: hypothetical protein VN521_06745 [Negativicutes bacterium]|nr:hypothetical protein [Negativicutes bacterium]
MLSSLSSADTRQVGRGLLIFAVAIVIGVVAVDNQLSRLTARHDFGQVLNIRRDEAGYYHAYAFGQSCEVKAAYPVGTVTGGDGALTVAVAGHKLIVPTAARFELGEVVYWLEVWRRQFVAAALRTKQELAVYGEELRPIIRNIVDGIKR